ncbi:hypothetical protein Tco_1426308 [Tanacetum coccineum]
MVTQRIRLYCRGKDKELDCKFFSGWIQGRHLRLEPQGITWDILEGGLHLGPETARTIEDSVTRRIETIRALSCSPIFCFKDYQILSTSSSSQIEATSKLGPTS